MGMIRREIAKISGHEMEVDFILPPKYNNIKKRKNVGFKKKRSVSRLNPRFHFNSFVVGNNNRLAHAAALAVAQSPARAYNPLFIYGKVGLGKTHLLQAIGHYITENSELTFTYLSSEQFTNELINAIRDDKTTVFRRRYRNADVLLVDDIHFLAGKERTQEEFFHTFNALHEAHKQIVLSSDRSPIEIPTLEKRLQSRFEWGLIADIQPPDLETRIAILKKKAEIENMELPDEVATFIAERIKTNIRKLEGCLVRITAHSSLFKEKIDMNSVKEILKGILPEEKPRPITVELVQKTVSKYYKIKESTIKGKKRSRSIAFPRQIAMYLCRELTEDSFPEIGAKFGGKDHTTVMYAYRKIVEQAKKDEVLSNELKELENILKTS
ncbi:Chromosomal replication initiator protein DnaA [subsurface metagenome]